MTGPEPVRCATHPGVMTNLRCGKCDKPICPRCLVQTPVGARCRVCARLYTLPTYRLSGRHYLVAALVALGLAVVIGPLWGIVEALLPSYIFSLVAAMGLGWVIGEIISLSVNRKRSIGLAVIGAVSVALCFGAAYIVDYLRTGIISLDLYRIVFSLVTLGVGIYFAVNRLR
jgi:hypothetical protein